MENKLEFLNSEVVPLYNWEKWDTIRNNWNYYKQYNVAPTEIWTYKIENCPSDLPYYGYDIGESGHWNAPMVKRLTSALDNKNPVFNAIIPGLFGDNTTTDEEITVSLKKIKLDKVKINIGSMLRQNKCFFEIANEEVNRTDEDTLFDVDAFTRVVGRDSYQIAYSTNGEFTLDRLIYHNDTSATYRSYMYCFDPSLNNIDIYYMKNVYAIDNGDITVKRDNDPKSVPVKVKDYKIYKFTGYSSEELNQDAPLYTYATYIGRFHIGQWYKYNDENGNTQDALLTQHKIFNTDPIGNLGNIVCFDFATEGTLSTNRFKMRIDFDFMPYGRSSKSILTSLIAGWYRFPFRANIAYSSSWGYMLSSAWTGEITLAYKKTRISSSQYYTNLEPQTKILKYVAPEFVNYCKVLYNKENDNQLKLGSFLNDVVKVVDSQYENRDSHQDGHTSVALLDADTKRYASYDTPEKLHEWSYNQIGYTALNDSGKLVSMLDTPGMVKAVSKVDGKYVYTPISIAYLEEERIRISDVFEQIRIYSKSLKKNTMYSMLLTREHGISYETPDDYSYTSDITPQGPTPKITNRPYYDEHFLYPNVVCFQAITSPYNSYDYDFESYEEDGNTYYRAVRKSVPDVCNYLIPKADEYIIDSYQEQGITLSKIDIEEGALAPHYLNNLVRRPELDYVEPGPERPRKDYGIITYYKVGKILKTGFERTCAFDCQNLTEDWYADYGDYNPLCPERWITNPEWDKMRAPIEEIGEDNLLTESGQPVRIQFTLTNTETYEEQPYQPVNGVIVSTNHYVEEPREEQEYQNFARLSADGDKWEVWDYAYFTNHPNRFIGYVESFNPDEYPAVLPEYNADTDSWNVNGVQNSYWYWNTETTTGHALTLYDKDIRDGVSYTLNQNSSTDIDFSNAGSAEVKYHYYNSQELANELLNEPFLYYKRDTGEHWQQIGRFYNTDMSKKRNYVDFTAYDDMLFTNISANGFIKSLTYPITVEQFFIKLCQLCNLEWEDNTVSYPRFANANYLIKNNFTEVDMSARSLFMYLAQILSCFFGIDKDGKIYAGLYQEKAITLNKENYSEYQHTDKTITPISKVSIKTSSLDGFSLGDNTGDEYQIVDNPMLYTQTQADVQPVLEDTLNRLSAITYTPGTIQMLKDLYINVGDIITVDGNTFYVMKKETNNNGVKLECVGTITRNTKYNDGSTLTGIKQNTSRIQQLASVLDIDLTDYDTRFALLTGKVSTLNGEVATINIDNQERDERMDGFDTSIANIRNLVNQHTSSIDNLSNGLSSLSATIGAIDGRLTSAEQIINSHSQSIITINNDIAGIDQELAQVNRDIARKMDKTDMKADHMATVNVNTNYATFISPTGVFYCSINSLKQPTAIIKYIDWATGKTNLEITTDEWHGQLPQDIIW